MVFLTGEAGTGKTTLVRAFRERLDHRHRFRLGRCEPLSTPIPFGPLYELLPELSGEHGFLPAERGRRGDLFRAVVEEVASERSVFVVEDLHFADEATIDLIGYLGRRIRETPTVLVCTFRREEVDRRHPLSSVVGELGGTATRMDLQPLTVGGVTALATGIDVDPLEVYAATGGNPLFVMEMLAHPGESLPATIADSVLARARTLPPTAWDVLDQVALSPEGVPLSVVDELGEEWEADVDRAVALGLLEFDAGRLRCRHDLIRRALDANLPPATRLRVHRRMFDMLSERAVTAADVVAVAHHAVNARLPQEAVTWSLRAARRAAADGAHREAASHYTAAIEHREVMDADTAIETIAALSYESYLTGDLERAATRGHEVYEMARDAAERGRALRWMSRLAWFRGHRNEALEWGRAAVQTLEEAESDAHELAFAYSNMAQLAMLDADVEATERWANEALAIARPAGDVEVVAHALNNLGTATKDPAVWHHLEESLDLSLEHDLPEHAARAFTNLAYEAVWFHDLDRAERHLRRGIDFSEARDLGTWWWYMRGTRSRVHLLRGRWDDARLDAMAVLETHSDALMRHDALVTLARLRLRCGEESAFDTVTDVVEVALSIDEYTRLNHAADVAAEWCWVSGDRVDRFDDLIEAALSAAAARNDSWGAARIGFWQLRCGLPLPEMRWAPFLAKELSGDRPGAVSDLQAQGAVYEAAVAQASIGRQAAVRSGFGTLERLGAERTLDALRRDLRERGVEGLPRRSGSPRSTNTAGLTPRQMEVLRGIAAGMSNADIADDLYISPKTAEHHVSAILSKLGVRSRTEALVEARSLGLLER